MTLRNIAGPTRREGYSFDADDRDPAMAARMSFNRMDRERTRQQDLDLCDYLMRNKHTSPFEMVVVWLEMKMPIFVARQFVRHRTVSINEVSARYVQLPAEWYLPSLENVGVRPKSIKQGRKIVPWTEMTGEQKKAAKEFCFHLDAHCQSSYKAYGLALNDGIPPELARSFLHMNHYTHWLWKQDLHNLMHFLSLRDHSHAQYEAQQYAKAVDTLVREQLPHTMELYDKYRRLGD